MQRITPEYSQYMTTITQSRPVGRERLNDAIARGLDRLDAVVVRSLRAVGRAWLEGVISYGFVMHGLPPLYDTQGKRTGVTEAPSANCMKNNVTEAPFETVEDFFMWLESQSKDHGRDDLTHAFSAKKVQSNVSRSSASNQL